MVNSLHAPQSTEKLGQSEKVGEDKNKSSKNSPQKISFLGRNSAEQIFKAELLPLM